MNYLDAITLSIGRRLPLILQTEATECGLACLAMIAGYHGHHTTLMELRRQFSVSLKGVTLKQLTQTADQLKFGTRAMRVELEDLSKLTLPCVLHWDFNHFVVLKVADGRRLTLHDPAHGIRQLSLDEASKSFTGVALEVWPHSDFEKQEAKPQIKLMSMLGRVSGLYRALSQVLLLALALEVFSLVSPFLLQWTLDNVLITQDRDLLTTLIIGFGLLLLMQQLVSATRAWVMMHMSTLLSVQWRANVYSHLLRLPIQYFEKRHLGDIVSRFGAIGEIQGTLTADCDDFVHIGSLGLVSPFVSGKRGTNHSCCPAGKPLSGNRARHAHNKVVPTPERATLHLAWIARRTDQRRVTNPEAATGLHPVQRLDIRTGESTGAWARCGHGDEQPIQCRCADGVYCL
jgi:ATP-binding cassette subfamily B protein RaxB